MKKTGTFSQDVRFQSVIGVLLLLYVAYTAMNILHMHRDLVAIVDLLPGVWAITFLLVTGFSRQDCFLGFGRLSRKGLIVLGLVSLGMLVPVLPFVFGRGWTGFHWLPVLAYAPASGIAQELYFRDSLLPVLLRLFQGKPILALALQAVLFGLWHLPHAYLSAPTAPLPVVAGVVAITSLAGLAWGWQVWHDRTIAWTAGEHVLLLMVFALLGL